VKILASIIVVILLFCGGALWFLAGESLNQFIKAQIETVGKQATEQTVTVDKVDIILAQGAGTILGINLANPENYQAKNVISLGEITLDINLKSLVKSKDEKPIVIDAIIIKDVKTFVEFNQTGGSNIKELIDIINKNTDKSSSKTEESPKESPDATEPKISVTKVILAGTALNVDLTALGNKVHALTLPDINLTNIGGEAGMPASQLGNEILKQALNKIWQKTKKVQKEKILKKAKDELKDKAKKKLADLFGK